MKRLLIAALLTGAACSSKPAAEPAKTEAPQPKDAQHAAITTPHGDHSPHHGGLVMMNGEVHYEVVFDGAGKHRLWFSDAVREDLPASIAADVVMTVTPKMGSVETFKLKIDESGESWIADGRPLALVHGGGAQITALMERRGIPARFVDGRRFTDLPTLACARTALADVSDALAAEPVERVRARAARGRGRDEIPGGVASITRGVLSVHPHAVVLGAAA